MAFKATAKKTTTKKTTAKTAEKPVIEKVSQIPEIKTEPPKNELSIEDLVGGPVAAEARPREPAKIPVTQSVPAESFVKPVAAEIKPETPAGGPDTQFTQPQSYRPRSYQPGFRPMRRDFGGGRYNQPRQYNENNNGFTQDINVPTETVHGILDIMPEGHGFLRPKFTPSDRDVYISQSQIRRFLLRNGDMVEGQARPPKENERYWGLLKVEKIDEQPAEGMAARPKFEDLTPVYPNLQLKLETGIQPLSTRMIDLIAPIGFGQRGLIVSPPKAGKTTILKELAAGIAANYPNVHLMAALIGERPEEVTDITRSVHGEVLASNFDESPSEQTRIAEVALDRAKRLVEMGKDVVILLDSITRLARAYNLVVNPSGRTLSGGFDPAALYPAKKFLGAARCVEPVAIPMAVPSSTPADPTVNPDAKTPAEIAAALTLEKKRYTAGGSLTVIGTALVDTGSRMDDLIYEEFKGTGNMELTLSRTLQERRVFPAIDIEKSGTRHDELLLGEEQMKKVTTLRHMLSLLSAEERTMMVIERISKTTTNEEFLDSLSKG
jgi:transcription termination factor Rho